MEETIIAALLADAGVSARAETRVHLSELPQDASTGALPAVVLNVTAAPHGYTMEGDDNLIPYRATLDCWAANPGDAKLLARAASRALSGQTFDGIQGVFVNGEREDRDVQPQTTLYRTQLDLTVWAEAPDV